MNNEKTVLQGVDSLQFREWLQLNVESVSWQGRYEQEFNEFWGILFSSGKSFGEVFAFLRFLKVKSPKGPLGAWLGWVSDRLLCYFFVHHSLTLRELAYEARLPFSEVATTVRNFFSEIFPQHEEFFSHLFQMTHVANSESGMTFADLIKKIPLSDSFAGVREGEVMSSMEITLYPEWHELYRFLTAQNSQEADLEEKSAPWKNKKEYLKAFREVLILLLIGLVLLFSLKIFNGWYEKYLADKIKIFEPQFLWSDKRLAFKPQTGNKKSDLNLPRFVDLENVDISLESDSERVITEKDPFVTESEVVLADVESLPKDLDTASGNSVYDEKNKVGLREDSRSNKKAYRLMIKATDVMKTRGYIDQLSTKYQAMKADKVLPGTYVPGGLYYNLFVPNTLLREFIAQVSQGTESTLYESRARYDNPPGKSKVFVWVKVF